MIFFPIPIPSTSKAGNSTLNQQSFGGSSTVFRDAEIDSSDRTLLRWPSICAANISAPIQLKAAQHYYSP